MHNSYYLDRKCGKNQLFFFMFSLLGNLLKIAALTVFNLSLYGHFELEKDEVAPFRAPTSNMVMAVRA
jgi:hypothetical protein